MRDVLGLQLVQLKNPWSKVRSQTYLLTYVPVVQGAQPAVSSADPNQTAKPDRQTRARSIPSVSPVALEGRVLCARAYLLTYSLTHLLTYLLTHLLTYLLTNLLTYLLTPQLRWKGAYSVHDTKRWTPELRKTLAYDQTGAMQHDNGVFWIDYASLQRFFQVSK